MDFSALFDEIKLRLSPIPLALGDDALARHAVRPRVVWVPGTEELSPATKGWEVRHLYTLSHTCTLHVQAASYQHAAKVRAAVLTAFVDVLGSGRVSPGPAQWAKDEALHNGVVLAQELIAHLDLHATSLPPPSVDPDDIATAIYDSLMPIPVLVPGEPLRDH